MAVCVCVWGGGWGEGAGSGKSGHEIKPEEEMTNSNSTRIRSEWLCRTKYWSGKKSPGWGLPVEC